ncbi:inclusion body family protein [Vibrio sp. Isolate25]|uniref:AidA/PixA family protein n=1 Tax=Vibrio sp. Isolate25 TaxID=2908535 RepID=UPI001EFC549B|nr:AidA/PixA family protein [Vibrio sp. Isolate25]MCG9597292.1 inclusion body family protein [Vibrio sp. Isolate25]
MAVYNILTVFKADGFENAPHSSFNDPTGGGRHWRDEVFMITNAGSGLTGGNATSNLHITVKPGDVINWLDTPISQGLRNKGSSPDIDIVVYGMYIPHQASWDRGLTELKGKTQNSSHVYITSNFDTNEEPDFQAVTFPNNICTTTVKNVSERVDVTYYLKVAKLDLSDSDNIKVLGWYQIDPKITILPN